MLDAEIQAENAAMIAETEKLAALAVTLRKRIALRDALLDRNVSPKLIRGAAAVIDEYVHVEDDGTISGPDHMPLGNFLDAWCESGEGQAFANGGRQQHQDDHLMADIARNMS
jgi:hypothetical protein